tara:strand:+ start:214 stop:450 length:237 start_codon:yes stop_codon:yes gene_type:complete
VFSKKTVLSHNPIRVSLAQEEAGGLTIAQIQDMLGKTLCFPATEAQEEILVKTELHREVAGVVAGITETPLAMGQTVQ